MGATPSSIEKDEAEMPIDHIWHLLSSFNFAYLCGAAEDVVEEVLCFCARSVIGFVLTR